MAMDHNGSFRPWNLTLRVGDGQVFHDLLLSVWELLPGTERIKANWVAKYWKGGVQDWPQLYWLEK